MFAAIKNSELFFKVSEAYFSLSSRDRLAVNVLAAFALLVIIIYGLLIPAYQYSAEAQQRYKDNLDALQWMQANQQKVKTLAAGNRRQPGQSLLGVANTTAKDYQLDFKRYEPAGDNSLNLWLENIVFDQLVLWLENLDKNYGIRIQEIAVDKQQQGRVNVRLVLQG